MCTAGHMHADRPSLATRPSLVTREHTWNAITPQPAQHYHSCAQPLTDPVAERDEVGEPKHDKLALQADAVEDPGRHGQGHKCGHEQLLRELVQQVGDDVVQPIATLTGEEVAPCRWRRGREGRRGGGRREVVRERGQAGCSDMAGGVPSAGKVMK